MLHLRMQEKFAAALSQSNAPSRLPQQPLFAIVSNLLTIGSIAELFEACGGQPFSPTGHRGAFPPCCTGRSRAVSLTIPKLA